MITITDQEHAYLLYQRDVLAKIWGIVKPDEESDYDTNNLYDYVREGVEAKKRLAEGERAIKEYLGKQFEDASVEFDKTIGAIEAAVIAERERCAKIAEVAFEHMSPLAFYERYNADGKYITRLNPEKSARAIAAKIRSGE